MGAIWSNVDIQDEVRARFFDFLGLWDTASLRAKGLQICTYMDPVGFDQYDFEDEPDFLFDYLDFLNDRAEANPEVVACYLHSWLGHEMSRDMLMSRLVSEAPRIRTAAYQQGSARLRYQRLLDAAMRVDDLLIFMTTADEEGWPEGEAYGSIWHTGFHASAGQVLRRWLLGSTVVSSTEVVDALLAHLFHPEWKDPGCSSSRAAPGAAGSSEDEDDAEEADGDESGSDPCEDYWTAHCSPIHPGKLVNEWLLPLVKSFTHDFEAARLEQYASWLGRGKHKPMRAALEKAVVANATRQAQPSGRAHLPKLYPSHRALPRAHFLWPDEWKVGAC